MSEPTIRRAIGADIPGMAALWHEKMLLQLQTDRRYHLAPDARIRWSQAIQASLEEPECAIHVLEIEGEIQAYVVARLQASPAGLEPEKHGSIDDMALDIHSQQRGLGRLLVEAARQWFIAQGIQHALIKVPRNQPVEQAFWRALGAVDVEDSFWMKL